MEIMEIIKDSFTFPVNNLKALAWKLLKIHLLFQLII